MLSDLQLFDSSIVRGSNARISAKFRRLLFLCEQAWPPNDICEFEYYMRRQLKVCIRYCQLICSGRSEARRRRSLRISPASAPFDSGAFPAMALPTLSLFGSCEGV
jgi:hypothetical protein